MKKAELIVGIVGGITVGIILSPKKIYELKNRTKETYYNFLLENGPITKDMVINYLKEKRVAYKNRGNDGSLDDIEEEKKDNEKLAFDVLGSEEEHK